MKCPELKQQVQQFLSGRQNANLLPVILSPLYSKESVGVDLVPVVRAFKNIYTELNARGEVLDKRGEGDSPEATYRKWLEERFWESIDRIFEVLDESDSAKLQSVCLETLITFLKLKNDENGLKDIAKRLVRSFLNPESSLADSSGKVLSYLKESRESRREFMHLVQQELAVKDDTRSSDPELQEEFMRNVLEVVKLVLRAEAADGNKTEESDKKVFRKSFTRLWKTIMKWDSMTQSVVRFIVTLLPDYVMDNIDNPVQMSDFLLESFKIGGPLGILSLRGIFVLMLKHNMEVPDFYTKLYSLFELPVLHSNYRARFFRYTNQFLSSTHLPEYLVAAFIKKLARMCLLAPAPAVPLICNFIVNLMIRHPGLQVLIHNTTVNQVVENDPYLLDETDPSKTNALESSLWEMKTLQNHAMADVAHACSFIEKNLPKVEYDLEEKLSQNYDDLLEWELKQMKNIPQLDERYFEPVSFKFEPGFKRLGEAIGNDAKKSKDE